MSTEYVRHLLRCDTTKEWERTNPILKYGEIVVDITLHKLKVGNGVSNYLDLPYMYTELYSIIDTIVRMIAKINGSGRLLESVDSVYSLDTIHTKLVGDLCFVLSEGRFYYYSREGWKIATADVDNKVPVDTVEDLESKYNTSPIGTMVYVIKNQHYYVKTGNGIWKCITDNSDKEMISSIVSIDELNSIENPKNGQIVYVLSKKKHYYYDGIRWELLSKQFSTT